MVSAAVWHRRAGSTGPPSADAEAEAVWQHPVHPILQMSRLRLRAHPPLGAGNLLPTGPQMLPHASSIPEGGVLSAGRGARPQSFRFRRQDWVRVPGVRPCWSLVPPRSGNHSPGRGCHLLTGQACGVPVRPTGAPIPAHSESQRLPAPAHGQDAVLTAQAARRVRGYRGPRCTAPGV